MVSFLVLTGSYVLIGGLGISIFLWGKPDGNSGFDKAYRLVCQILPRLLKRGLEKVFGPRAPKALDAAWTYVCFSSNPIVQFFYLMVLVGGYMVFVSCGYPHVPNRLAGGWHKYTGFLVFVTCVSVWWKACSTDPGTVTEENVEALVEMFPFDDHLFSDGACRTCRTRKPARSKHCSMCGICVARFDHHCIWINNCVGLGNHKWFLAFLFWHSVICSYGCGLGCIIILDLVREADLFSAVFLDPETKEKHTASYTIVARYMLVKEGMIIFVTILAAIMGLVLFGFFLWHLNLVRTGQTTNEMSKWSYLRWYLRKQGDEGKEQAKLLKNSFNFGCVANFREVFFPPDVHQLVGVPVPAQAVKPDGKRAKPKRADKVKGSG